MDMVMDGQRAAGVSADRPVAEDSTPLAFGPFRLDPDGRLRAGGRAVPLTPTEERLLRVLVEAEGGRVAREEILQRVWTRRAASDASLARCVHTLRRRLVQASGGISCIRTDYGRGYRLELPVEDLKARREASPRSLPSKAAVAAP
jgi:DNA-binding winged helix-turn-helix (wHTH) protein